VWVERELYTFDKNGNQNKDVKKFKLVKCKKESMVTEFTRLSFDQNEMASKYCLEDTKDMYL
jgi:hypothetical protein